jgi:tetratricopeptide (TPR) repeat protein
MLAKLARELAFKVIRRNTPGSATSGSGGDRAFLDCVSLMDAGRIDDARECYEKLIAREPGNAVACNNLGIIHHRQDAPAKAISVFEQAIASAPLLAEPHVNLANVLQDRCELRGALEHYEAALELNPELVSARYGRAATLLALGRFEEGWREYEWRAHLAGASAPRSALRPRWDGSQDLNGKRIVLHAEQGFGDAIQFIRYAPLVAACGAEVIVECQPALQSLFRSVEGVSETITATERIGADYEIPLMSLPLAFATDARSIPAKVPYLAADATATRQWRERFAACGEGRKVGLAWSGNPTHAGDRKRSLPLDYLSELTRVPGCTFVSLQKSEAPIGREQLESRGIDLHDFTAGLTDFRDTAACISALDAVVAVDTAVAHLAGALAKPAFVALPFAADWRWLAHGRTTAWYPTMRLVRQPAPGDWHAVVQELRQVLEAGWR